MKILVPVVLTLTLASASVYADGIRDFILYNHSSKTIEALYVSTPGYDTWRHVRIDEAIPPNGYTTIKFDQHSSPVCDIQLRADFRDGTYTEFTDTLNLCASRSVTITYNEETRSFLATAEPYAR